MEEQLKIIKVENNKVYAINTKNEENIYFVHRVEDLLTIKQSVDKVLTVSFVKTERDHLLILGIM